MDKIEKLSKYISKITTINDTYIYLIIRTIIFLLIITLIQKLILKIIKKIKNSKKEYFLVKD